MARAFGWVKRNAVKHGGNPDRVFVGGHSAGAHLAALLATDSTYLKAEKLDLSDVAGVAAISGGYRILAIRKDVFGDDDAMRLASPFSHLKGGHPPFLIVYGDGDTPERHSLSKEFRDALRAAGGEAEILEVKDRTHAELFGKIGDGDPTTEAVLTFVERTPAGTKPITFGEVDEKRVPNGWTAAKTGTGDGSVWKVVADGATPGKTGFALSQTAEGPKGLFNLCVLDGSRFKDGEVSVAVKAVGGTIDQGGGVVWRYTDANNYYVCRYNPLERNLRVYHVRDGNRTQLETAENLDPKAGEWFTVSVKQIGKRIECSLNGKKLLEVTDDALPGPGKVGVWCKADARSHFDQFQFAPAR